MSILDKPVASQLQSGLNKDYTFKPASYTSFVLNGVRDSHDGGKTQYQSEPGNTLVESIPADNGIVGWIYGQNNEIYLFSRNRTDDTSEVGIFKDGLYDTVFSDVDLGFDPRYPITGEYRLKNGCERVIYWCDGHNPDYFYNFDRPSLFKDDLDVYDPNLFRLVPKVSPPKIDLVSVNDSGGNLPLGSYYFQIELLDGTLNSIYKTDISPQTPIIDDSYGDIYSHIDGGLNIAQYSEEIGGVPISTKSITLRLYNLDTSFAYLRINVVRQIAGTQAIDAHAVGALIPIGSEDFMWTYTGYNPTSGDYPLDYSELITNNVRYDTAYVMEQVQGRLVRAALKQDVRDYSMYQREASKIDVRWYSQEVLHSDIDELGNEKNPHTYWLMTSHQGDEIVALGIRYLHDDGTWSPVFHIPGRPATFSDRTLHTIVDNAAVLGGTDIWESDVTHLNESDFTTWNGDYIGSTIEKWKVFNTAYVTDSHSGVHPFIHEGKMGFYEGITNYPDIRDCDNALIWGEDSGGNEITAETPIRHHKIPDRGLLAIWSGDFSEYIRPIGLKFYNIAYPSTDIVGHQFCHVIRDESSKTVLDSGWFAKRLDDTNLLIIDPDGGSTTYGIIGGSLTFGTEWIDSGAAGQLTGLYGEYVSAAELFNKTIFRPSHIKFNRAHSLLWTPFDRHLEIFDVEPDPDIRIGLLTIDTMLGFSDTPTRRNYTVDKQILLEPQSKLIDSPLFDVDIVQWDFLTSLNIIKSTYEYENMFTLLGLETFPDVAVYTYKKSNVRPYENLFNLQYKYLNFNYNDSIDSEDNIFYNGDTIISKMSVNKLFGVGFGGPGEHLIDNHNYMFEEHQFNSAYRHGGTLDNTTYYKNDNDFTPFIRRMATLMDNNTWEIKPTEEWSPDYYAYNRDFDKQFLDQTKFSIPITYNYCSNCIGEFNSRIIFSPKSFDEETFDLYRINKVNDYIDLPGHRGQITGLKYKNNILLVHCKEGTFILQPNPQAISTNTSEIYLTTGDFLGLPPAELMQTDIGYAGCQSKQHQCDTPNGWCWTDQLRSKIFKFNGKLEEISNRGMTQWFDENLPSDLQYAFYQIFQEEYSTTSTLTVENNGIGLIMFYDPKFNRLFISKKDFLPIGFRDRAEDIGDLTYDFDNSTWTGVNNLGEVVIVEFKDIEWFENKSWTLSYSFDYEQGDLNPWTSWHSYIPPFAFWDNFHYYTMPIPDSGYNVRAIHKHVHEGNYQSYYGTKHDFIIEWMDYSPETRDFNSIHYTGYTLQWNDVHKQWIQDNNVTFNRGMFYTFNQSTGLIDLRLVDQHGNPYTKIESSNTEKTIVRTDNNFKITGLYDIATSLPVVTSQWSSIQDDYYIDKVVNNSALNYNQSTYQLGNIRDKFIISRLYFNSEADYKKVVSIVQNHNSISIR